MKFKTLTLLFLIPFIVFAQKSRFSEGETIYVWAEKGLNLRKLPDAKSEKIAALPYGTKVSVQPNIGIIVPYEVEEFKDFKVKGVWLLVKYEDKEGFVFDGYMSRLVAPIKNEEWAYSAMDKYLELYDKKAGKVLSNRNGENIYLEDFTELKCGICTQKYQSGIVKTGHFGDGIPQIEYHIPTNSYYEGYIFMKVFYGIDFKTSKFQFIKKENKFFIDNEDKDSGGGCYFYLKKQNNKVIIRGECYC